MPRLIFSSEEVFISWCREFVNPNKYVAYFESRFNRFVVYPLKTSRPTTFASYQLKHTEDPKKLREFLASLGVQIYDIVYLEWDTERGM
jgi:hypothetical protein